MKSQALQLRNDREHLKSDCDRKDQASRSAQEHHALEIQNLQQRISQVDHDHDIAELKQKLVVVNKLHNLSQTLQ